MSRLSYNPNSFRRGGLEALEPRLLLTVDMSPQEQLFIELINRARADPVAEIERNPDVDDLNQDVSSDKTISEEPKQPLAPNQALTDAMRAHVTDMLRRNYFGHTSPEGSSPTSRARAAGFSAGAGENLAWSGNTSGVDRLEEVYLRHEGLITSVGHRVNMMRENWREVGAGIDYGIFTEGTTNFQAVMAGSLFGNRRGDNFITGVAITDHIIANDFYEMGEGIRGVTVTATRLGTNETYSDVSGSSGGYSIQVPEGTYDITATGRNLSRPILVRGIQVEGKNVKLDINNTRMPTRYIAGQFYEDVNSNGQRDRGETGLAGRVAYVDLNDDGRRDTDEPRIVSGETGEYQIDGLLPGSYTVRQELPEGWQQTVPSGTYVIPLSDRNLIGVDFGSHGVNGRPIAVDDVASAQAVAPVVIAALSNDRDPENELAVGSLRIESEPTHGTVSVSESQFVYVASPNFSGVDRFTYTVADHAGRRSNVATIEVHVTEARGWQNPVEPLDVNRDGVVVSSDALIIIRELNINGPRSLGDLSPEGSSFYFDVNGDAFLSSLDALRIIRHLNMQSAAAGEPASSQDHQPASDAYFAILGSLVQDDDRYQW